MEENEQVMSDEIREEQCCLREAKGKANSYGMALHIKEHRQPFTSKGNRVCDERVSGGTDSF